MPISDIISDIILDLIEAGGTAEIKRNEMASKIGCVPSQINYVLSSRFTPEHGFIVESRRGGGGYIKITRVSPDKDISIMHIINSIGTSIDEITANLILSNISYSNLISDREKKLFYVALSDSSYRSLPPVFRDSLRANIMKKMLLSLLDTRLD